MYSRPEAVSCLMAIWICLLTRPVMKGWAFFIGSCASRHGWRTEGSPPWPRDSWFWRLAACLFRIRRGGQWPIAQQC
jgi:hypothetical protein